MKDQLSIVCNSFLVLVGVFTLAMFVVGCSNPTESEAREVTIDRCVYKILELEGCEYIVSISSKDISHKGDCKNPIHQGLERRDGVELVRLVEGQTTTIQAPDGMLISINATGNNKITVKAVWDEK